MPRYIDADAVLAHIKEFQCGNCSEIIVQRDVASAEQIFITSTKDNITLINLHIARIAARRWMNRKRTNDET